MGWTRVGQGLDRGWSEVRQKLDGYKRLKRVQRVKGNRNMQ